MADAETRPFSKNYSGLVNQSVIGMAIICIAIASQEVMKRKRRGSPEKWKNGPGVGSRESWEFGYMYQGRSWARTPSPPIPLGWPLSWVKESLTFPEGKMNALRGVDATLYIRFLRGCCWFTLAQSLTTLPILLPIHVHFAGDSVSSRSMTRASISSLVTTSQGLSLLWIHICLLIWITFSWMVTLMWICHGAFKYRAQKIEETAREASEIALAEKNSQYHPHPHPQYPFQDIPVLDPDHSTRGLRLRTVMVSNIPPQLRKSEKDLKEYFEYYMSRPLHKPGIGLTTTSQPGFFNKMFSFLVYRISRIPAHLRHNHASQDIYEQEGVPSQSIDGKSDAHAHLEPNSDRFPVVDRVVIARRMMELASLLERREDVLRRLETAHIKLARKVLTAVRLVMDQREQNGRPRRGREPSHISLAEMSPSEDPPVANDEQYVSDAGYATGATVLNDAHMDILVEKFESFVKEFDVQIRSRREATIDKLRNSWRKDGLKASADMASLGPPQDLNIQNESIVWDVLLSLPRDLLDPYQPLIHLSALFRGKTVPAIDYYTAKLGLLTSLITENRAKAVSDYVPVSTAFVTFADPKDARRACKYLAVHPDNPLSCLVTMAPGYEDLLWVKVMKTTFRAEFLKDWVVGLGVWGFTVFWLFPVSILVGFVSVDSIGQFWPALKNYLDRHAWEEELIESFFPTLLIALLSLLVPVILLLIAKKAHTITTISVLHDTILTRYYKFLIVNVLVFFCIGTAAVQSVLLSVSHPSGMDIINIVATSFPTAAPFYVGWLIFTMAMHGGFELALIGLPLLMYPSTSRQVTPRKRTVGIRPRTYNYFYWLPNHTLVVHIVLLFAVLNPLVIPFSWIYFIVERVVVQNQFLHVYAKNYEGNGRVLLIRIVRFSLDGLLLAQAVFMAYMIVLKKKVNIALSVVLIVITAVFKLSLTRIIRAQYERDDILEADIVCRTDDARMDNLMESGSAGQQEITGGSTEAREVTGSRLSTQFWTWKLRQWVSFSYSTNIRVTRQPYTQRHRPNPFGPRDSSFSRLDSSDNIHDLSPQPGLAATEEHPSANVGPHDDSDLSKVVVPHPPPPSWDDEPHPDQPYDNPFYTKPVCNVLWLPRNPCGILDLDDTVDMRKSLTTEPGAGQLGTWLGQSAFVNPVEQQLTPQTEGEPTSTKAPSSSELVYDGSEDIDLPPAIARRVRELEKEHDVEHANLQRPSLFMPRRRATQGSYTEEPPRLDRRTTSESLSVFGKRSASTLPRPSHRGSFLSIDHLPSQIQDPSAPSSVHAQGTVTQSHLSLVSPSALSVAASSQIRARANVSTQEAVVNEVLVEEQAIQRERMRNEEAEVQQSQRNYTWLTSWLFRKA